MTIFYNVLGGMMDAVRGSFGMPGYGNEDAFPPEAVAPIWQKIEDRRRRVRNDRDELLPYAPHFSASSAAKQDTYTPVPLSRDIARLSSQLLFSEDPRIVYESGQESLDELVSANSLAAHLEDSGEKVAVEGVGALKVIRDDEALDDIPIIAYVSGDQVIWEVRHGRFVKAGTTITTRQKTKGSADFYRLYTRHERGRITRTLYKGTSNSRGDKVALSQFEEFKDLQEEEPTVEGAMTLIPWMNVPGGYSDLEGMDRMLDRVDEAVSYGVSKMRKSDPWVVADRSLSDENGNLDLTGVAWTAEALSELGEGPKKLAEVVQPGLAAAEHLQMTEGLVNLALEMAGYSRATWGRDEGGSADSGKALKLRQVRTLMTRAGKDRMAKAAIGEALAVALAWWKGGDPKKIARDLVIHLGDGLPEDPLETAQEIAALVAAEAITWEGRVQKLHPQMSEADVAVEAKKLEDQYGQSPGLAGFSPPIPPGPPQNGPDRRVGGQDEDEEPEEDGD